MNTDTPTPAPPESHNEDDALLARAQRAERQAAELESQLAELNAQLEQARAQAAQSHAAHQLDLAISAAGAIDLDTARLLAQRLSAESPEASHAAIVARLVREKPFLFRKAALAPTAMSMRADTSETPLLDAAERAAAGDRAALLDYLRARRAAS